jgi:hypothetical protein
VCRVSNHAPTVVPSHLDRNLDAAKILALVWPARRTRGLLAVEAAPPHTGNNFQLAELSSMADARPNRDYFQALQRLCTDQAACTTNEATRSKLLGWAAPYRQQAERLEREQPEQN